jgi:hypothetical protein
MYIDYKICKYMSVCSDAYYIFSFEKRSLKVY